MRVSSWAALSMVVAAAAVAAACAGAGVSPHRSARLERGVAAARAGDYPVAIEELTPLLEAYPRHAALRYHLAVALKHQSEFGAAILHFNEALALWPADERGYRLQTLWGLALAYEAAGDCGHAASVWTTYLAEAPKYHRGRRVAQNHTQDCPRLVFEVRHLERRDQERWQTALAYENLGDCDHAADGWRRFLANVTWEPKGWVQIARDHMIGCERWVANNAHLPPELRSIPAPTAK